MIPDEVRGHVISVARRLPAGMHIYDNISWSKHKTLRDLQVLDGSNLLGWDGGGGGDGDWETKRFNTWRAKSTDDVY